MLVLDLVEQKSFVNQYLCLSQRPVSSFSFVSIFVWQDFFDFEFKSIDEHLCIFAQNETGIFQYLPPLGEKITPKIIQECFSFMEEKNGRSKVTRMENITLDQLGYFPKEKFDVYPKGYEYLYVKKDIIDFKGSDFKSKRSSYNQFVQNYFFEYLPFEAAFKEECLALYERWAKAKRDKNSSLIYRQMLEENRVVHELAMEHYELLDLVGRVVKVDGKIAGYTFGYELMKDVFCVFLETTDLNIKGVAAFIFREFCRDFALRAYRFVNVMDDFELNNVRETKMSFRPSVLVPAYVVSRKVIV